MVKDESYNYPFLYLSTLIFCNESFIIKKKKKSLPSEYWVTKQLDKSYIFTQSEYTRKLTLQDLHVICCHSEIFNVIWLLECYHCMSAFWMIRSHIMSVFTWFVAMSFMWFIEWEFHVISSHHTSVFMWTIITVNLFSCHV